MTRNPETFHGPAAAERRAAIITAFGRRPFTRGMAHDVGLTRDDLARGPVKRVFRGVYVTEPVVITHEVRCAAALLLAPPGARIAGQDAARLHGLPAPESDRMHVSLRKHSQYRAGHVIIHRHGDDEAASVMGQWGGEPLACSPPHRAVVEMAQTCSLVECVMTADAVLTSCDVGARTRTQQAWATNNGASKATVRRVADLARPGAESAPETATRLLLVLAGLPEPRLQVTVDTPSGKRRLDLGYDELKIGFEYDGEYHFASPEQVMADAQRDHELRALGWIVIHVVAKELFNDPLGVLRRVADALAKRGVFVTFARDWEPHFRQRQAVA